MKKGLIIFIVLLCLTMVLTGCNKKEVEDLQSQLATAQASLAEVTQQKADGDASLEALSKERDEQLAKAEANLQKLICRLSPNRRMRSWRKRMKR